MIMTIMNNVNNRLMMLIIDYNEILHMYVTIEMKFSSTMILHLVIQVKHRVNSYSLYIFAPHLSVNRSVNKAVIRYLEQTAKAHY